MNYLTALSLLSQGNTAEEILSILDDIVESIEEDELV